MSKTNKQKLKKPIYKRWWFILLIVLAIGAIGSNETDKSSDDESDNTIESNTETEKVADQTEENEVDIQVVEDKDPVSNELIFKIIEPNMYKVGADLEAGQYRLEPEWNEFGYFEITSDSTGSFDSIIANDNYNGSRYIELKEGQYFKFDNGQLIPIDEIYPQIAFDGYYVDGMYKIGYDIPPGEYKVIAESDAYIEIVTDLSGTLDSIVSNELFSSDRYYTFTEGQYVKLVDCKIQE